MNNVFTAIQNRDGEALSRMSGYEHQYTNNDTLGGITPAQWLMEEYRRGKAAGFIK